VSAAAVSWELVRPAGWLRVTDDPASDLAGIAVPDGARERLDRELERVRALARAEGQPDRRHWAFVPDVRSGAVPAVMEIELLRRGSTSLQELATALEEDAARADSGIWSRDVELKRLPNGAAVTGLDIVRHRSADGDDQLLERYTGTLAAPTPGIAVRLTITTYDLALFADLLAYGDEVLSGITFDGPRG
jgi:hypothetical protein